MARWRCLATMDEGKVKAPGGARQLLKLADLIERDLEERMS